MQFERFERRFEECLTRSAMSTRFEQRIVRGLSVVLSLLDSMERCVPGPRRAAPRRVQGVWMSSRWLSARARLRAAASAEHAAQQERLQLERLELSKLRRGVETYAADCEASAAELVQQVSTTVLRQIVAAVDRALPSIVLRFRYPDGPFDPAHLDRYVRVLATHVSEEMDREISHGCSETLHALRAQARSTMRQRAQALLSPVALTSPRSPAPPPTLTPVTRPEHDLYAVHIGSTTMLDGFQPDLQFRFALGLDRIGPRIFGRDSYNALRGLAAAVRARLWRTGQPKRTAAAAVEQAPAAATETSIWDHMALALSFPQSYALVTIAFSLASRPLFWKVAGAAVVGIGTVYGWQRLRYTRGAMERRLKMQFSAYAATRLRQSAQPIATGVANAVRVDCSNLLDSLRCDVSETDRSLLAGIAGAERALSATEAVVCRATELAHEAEALRQTLAGFQQELSDIDAPSLVRNGGDADADADPGRAASVYGTPANTNGCS